MLLSQDKIQAIKRIAVWGGVSKGDCGRYTWQWLKKNGIGNSDAEYPQMLWVNEKASDLYLRLALATAFHVDFGGKHPYSPLLRFSRFETRRAMKVEV